jgi:rhamnogalacturonyl hydrolase YesR
VGNTMAFVGEAATAVTGDKLAKAEIEGSIRHLAQWLDENDYRGYDTFDGLSAVYLRPLTFGSPFLRQVLQQGVRRFPLNLRPLLGIRKQRSTKGMGFLARGYIRLHQATGEGIWAEKAKNALNWLVEHRSKGYTGSSWGNHFDYQSRAFFLPKGVPTVVWTSLIGHAFLDGYEHFKDKSYLQIADSACEHIVKDLTAFPDGDGVCIAYVPGMDSRVHNANTLGASLLIRTYAQTHNLQYRDLAEKALQYTAGHQRADGSWYYGEKENLHWVDNFHTGYVLDCFLHYEQATGDTRFHKTMVKGYQYWKATFFLADGTPRYYNHKTLPLDIQCSSQAIDSLMFFQKIDPDAPALALKVAKWTIENMQDKSGYFFYRRYSPWIVNKTPTLHWGQATMLSALAALYQTL